MFLKVQGADHLTFWGWGGVYFSTEPDFIFPLKQNHIYAYFEHEKFISFFFTNYTKLLVEKKYD